MELAKGFLKSIFEREGEEAASLSRRDALAGLGLVGVAARGAETLGFNSPPRRSRSTRLPNASGSSPEVAKADEVTAADAGDATDLSARRYYRRRYYRPYWRRRYYVRRRYYRPYWRRRYWRRRYWRRRYCIKVAALISLTRHSRYAPPAIAGGSP